MYLGKRGPRPESAFIAVIFPDDILWVLLVQQVIRIKGLAKGTHEMFLIFETRR